MAKKKAFPIQRKRLIALKKIDATKGRNTGRPSARRIPFTR